MQRTCIAVVDASRARLFTLDRNAEQDPGTSPLVETADLVNPVRQLTQNELDDHHNARAEQLDRAFAKKIATEVNI